MDLKAVLVAGGSGSRLYPFTRYTHKTLLPLFDRPVIDYALNTIRRAGIKDITIIANEHIGQITRHIGAGLTNEKIHYVIEERPKGVAKALSLARPYVEGSRIMIYFSDNITTWDFNRDGEEFHSSEETPGAVLLAREVDDPQSFGICITDDSGEIVDIVEKPKGSLSNLAIGGIYLFDERFWEYFDAVTEEGDRDFSISDITRKYVKNGDAKVINVGEGTWVDCGTPEGLIEAGMIVKERKIRFESI